MNTARNEPKRDRYGRYLLPDPATGEERAWTRATTIAGLISDRYNLELWAQRMVAFGLAQRTDLLMLAKGVKDPKAGKQTLNRVVKQAKDAAAIDGAANIGTAIHAATEALDRGEVVDMPPPYDRDVEVYGAKMDALGIRTSPEWVERIVVNTALGVAGTFDRRVTIDDERFPLPVIADVKTGSTVHFSELEHAIQQAVYAHADYLWDPDTEQLVPMPETDRQHALIVHLPAGQAKCEVHVLDIARGIEAARVAVDVHTWRKVKGLSVPLG